MEMNAKMSSLLGQTKVQVPLIEDEESKSIALPALMLVDNSVLLKQEYERSRHAKVADFPAVLVLNALLIMFIFRLRGHGSL